MSKLTRKQFNLAQIRHYKHIFGDVVMEILLLKLVLDPGDLHDAIVTNSIPISH